MKASDFLKKIEQDREYQKEKEKQEEKKIKSVKEKEKIEAPFIEYIHKKGFNHINSLGDLTKSKDNTSIQDIILDWIPKISNEENSQEVFVRSLAVTKKPFDGKILRQLFDDSNSSPYLRWAIGNTIASAMVQNISEWLENKLKASEQPMENQMLSRRCWCST